MTPGARIAAAIEVLDRILAGEAAERALTTWARGHRFAGSKDRAAIRDHVFDALRRKRSLAAQGGAMTGRAILAAQAGEGAEALFTGEGHAPAPLEASERATLARTPEMTEAEALDLPDWLWPAWCKSLGPEAAAAARAQQDRADLFLRVNRRRGTVAAAQAALAAEEIDTEPHPQVRGALRVTGNPRRLATSRAYAEGLVEVQDAASQWAVAQVPLDPGARVLDYCAGGGGKALAFADRGAVVTAHDIAPQRMADIPARAKRAGVQIAVAGPRDLDPAARFDLVFCDAPCSGSGTWRRTPDAKWRLTPEGLAALGRSQRDALRGALGHVASGGRLAYATCSVLHGENDAVVEEALAADPGLTLESRALRLPDAEGDGFYLALILRHNP